MVVGILPNRKPRTRSAPGVHRFFIGSLFASNPLHEIQDKSFNGLNHTSHFNRFRHDQQSPQIRMPSEFLTPASTCSQIHSAKCFTNALYAFASACTWSARGRAWLKT